MGVRLPLWGMEKFYAGIEGHGNQAGGLGLPLRIVAGHLTQYAFDCHRYGNKGFRHRARITTRHGRKVRNHLLLGGIIPEQKGAVPLRNTIPENERRLYALLRPFCRSCTRGLRTMFRDLSRSVCVVSISRSSGFKSEDGQAIHVGKDARGEALAGAISCQGSSEVGMDNDREGDDTPVSNGRGGTPLSGEPGALNGARRVRRRA
jgi:hypothetical protein